MCSGVSLKDSTKSSCLTVVVSHVQYKIISQKLFLPNKTVLDALGLGQIWGSLYIKVSGGG